MFDQMSKLIKSLKAKHLVILGSLALLISNTACSYDPSASSQKVAKLQKTLLTKEASNSDMDFPSHQPSTVNGEKVFKQHCAKCHGADGSRFPSLDEMRGRTPQEQYLSITRGTDNMPSFRAALTRDERWDSLLYMRAQRLGSYPLGSAELSKMDSIFGANCAVCHGTRAQADGPLHKTLQPQPANFTSFERMYTRSDYMVFHRIAHGLPWTAMPAWKNRYDFDQQYAFDDELIWKLVRYVRQFGFSQTIDRLDKGRENIDQYKETLSKK